MKNYDVLVIGTGGGNKIATAAKKLGLSVGLVEKSKAGGTCLNRGCIPSKLLIYPSKYYKKLREAVSSTESRDNNFNKINLSIDSVSLDTQAMFNRINSYTDGIADRMAISHNKSSELDYYQGRAEFVSNNVIKVNGEELTAKQIFIAIGSRPNIPDIPGLAHTPFMTSNEALRSKELPKSLIVIGGGYIATELGSAYSAMGVEVTFLVRSKTLKQVDEDILEIFNKKFEKENRVITDLSFKSAKYEEGQFIVEIEKNGKVEEVLADELLVASGITPNSDQLGLEKTDISLKPNGFIEVNANLQTKVSNVYAIGDVAGNYLFRHSVNFEAEHLIENLLMNQKDKEIEYPPVPSAIFTDPEIASVGLSEKDLENSNIEYLVGRSGYNVTMPMSRGAEEGLVKIIFEKESGQLLGAHIVGDEASTLIQELVLALSHNMNLEDLNKQIYIHPAFPEVIRGAVRDGLKQFDPKYKVIF